MQVKRSKSHLMSSIALMPLVALGSLSAMAADDEDQAGLEEIIVTAEKTGSSNIQSTPLSITAVSSELLSARELSNFTDLDGKVPGLTVAMNEGLFPAMVIRGIGKESSQSGNVASVSSHLDGAFMNSDLLLNPDFLDVERIEVLRGPQGTIFGQNSVGGTVNVVTKEPNTEEIDGEVEVVLGNYNKMKAGATVNVPFSDSVAMRATMGVESRDGFSDNLLLPSAEPDGANNTSGRLKLLFQPSDSFKALLSASFFETDVDGRVQKNILDTTPGRDISQDFPTKFDYKAQVYIGTLEWETNFATIKSITGYSHEELLTQQDNDRLGIPFQNLIYQNNLPRESFTQEINMVSNGDGPLSWIVGGFYMNYDLSFDMLEMEDGNGDGVVDSEVADKTNPFATADLSFTVTGSANRESWSLFGQSTYAISDQLNLTAGLRYTEEEASGANKVFFLFDSETFFKSQMLTGKVGLDYEIDDNRMVYASYTRGAKPGGTNIPVGGSADSNLLVNATYGKEEVDAFEVGSKNRFGDGRYQLNLSGFYYDFAGYQFSATDPIPFVGGVDNIDGARVFGVESEFSALLGSAWRLDGNFTYLDTQITSDVPALDSVTAAPIFFDVAAKEAAIVNLRGNQLAKAPEFAANLSLSHTSEVDGFGKVVTSAYYNYRGGYHFRAYNNPATDYVPGYDTWDFNITVMPDDAPWTASLIVTNLENENAVNSRWTNTFGTAETSEGFVAPRQFMLRLGYKF